MSLRERIDRLEERERRLLGILSVVVAAILVLLMPLAVTAALHGSRVENQTLRDAIAQITTDRPLIEHSRALHKALEDRYSRPAPPLTSFLAKLAQEVEVEIPETQDRQPVPHGKRYEEKSTKITLRKVGMLKVARLMERIETAGHPLSISQLTIRKRGLEPDSYDVDMVVSAFERKPDKAAPAKTKAKDASAEAETEKAKAP
jgi:general secretion pathway protein M